MTTPVCPPHAPPIKMNNAASEASSNAVLSPFIVSLWQEATAYTKQVSGLTLRRASLWVAAVALMMSPLAGQVSTVTAQAPPPPTQPPVTKPSPSPSPSPSPASSGQPAAARAQAGGPFDGASVDPRLAGVSIYTGATYLQSF